MFGQDIAPYQSVTKNNFHDVIGGYFLLLDYTDKTFLVNDVKNSGSFLMSKCQDNFLVLSDFIEKEEIEDAHKVHIELVLNDEVR